MNRQVRSTTSDFNADLKLRGFKVYEIDSNASGHNYSRKDFYKISMTSGKYNAHVVTRGQKLKEASEALAELFEEMK